MQNREYDIQNIQRVCVYVCVCFPPMTHGVVADGSVCLVYSVFLLFAKGVCCYISQVMCITGLKL